MLASSLNMILYLIWASESGSDHHSVWAVHVDTCQSWCKYILFMPFKFGMLTNPHWKITYAGSTSSWFAVKFTVTGLLNQDRKLSFQVETLCYAVTQNILTYLATGSTTCTICSTGTYSSTVGVFWCLCTRLDFFCTPCAPSSLGLDRTTHVHQPTG